MCSTAQARGDCKVSSWPPRRARFLPPGPTSRSKTSARSRRRACATASFSISKARRKASRRRESWRKSSSACRSSPSEIMSEETPLFLQPDFLKKLERLRLIAKRLSWSSATGEHPTVRRGYSLEFSDYRKYQSGDDLRYVDWNVYRRLERLWLKLFTAEEEMNIYLLVMRAARWPREI